MSKNINVNKIISTTKEVSLHEVSLQIDGITLLSVEEYKKARDYIYPVDNTWWLRSPGISHYFAALVRGDGDFQFGGLGVDYEGGVRPALRINLKSSDLQIGDSFQFEEYTWTVITKDYALCDTTICDMPFRKNWKALDANNYESSDIKKFLDEWYATQINDGDTSNRIPPIEIEPKRPKGEWIRTTNPIGETIVVCSNCGKIRQQGYDNFCGVCGADMRGDKK